MKILLKHIDRIKEKPHHVRKQVAFAAAGTITALIAISWVATSLATGAFALKDTSFADATGGSTGLAASGSEAKASRWPSVATSFSCRSSTTISRPFR